MSAEQLVGVPDPAGGRVAHGAAHGVLGRLRTATTFLWAERVVRRAVLVAAVAQLGAAVVEALVVVDVERPLHVRVKARNEHGDEQLIEASGLESRVIQHEIDHLDGVLILDRTSRDQRKQAMRALREALEPRSAAA